MVSPPPAPSGRNGRHIRPALRKGKPASRGEGIIPIKEAKSESTVRLKTVEGGRRCSDSGGDLDALLEATRLRMAGLGEGGDNDRAVVDTVVSVNENSSDSVGAAVPSSAWAATVAAGKGAAGGVGAGAPRGILKKPKYAGKVAPAEGASISRTLGRKLDATGGYKEGNIPKLFPPRSSSSSPSPVVERKFPTAGIKGEVMERDPSSFVPAALPTNSLESAADVEGYRPSISQDTIRGRGFQTTGPTREAAVSVGDEKSHVRKGGPAAKKNEIQKGSGGGSGSDPTVLKTMGDVFNAGVISSPVEDLKGNVEAGVSFACMTTEEYEETVQLAKTMNLVTAEDGEGSGVKGKGEEEKSEILSGGEDEGRGRIDDPNDIHEGDMFDEEEAADEIVPVRDFDGPTDEEIFMGRCDPFGPDDAGGSGADCGSDGDSFIDFFGGADDEIDALPEPEPRPFIQLWKALSTLSTPATEEIVQRWGEEAVDPTRGDIFSDNQRLDPTYDTSDVGASRYAGLMAMLRMHLSNALSERYGGVECQGNRGSYLPIVRGAACCTDPDLRLF